MNMDSKQRQAVNGIVANVTVAWYVPNIVQLPCSSHERVSQFAYF
jgi:hypothetical protein